MRNTSWAVYATALLVGSSLAIITEASDAGLRWVPEALRCTATECATCAVDNCNLAYGESLEYLSAQQTLRCVDWDGDNVGHCSWVDMTNYKVWYQEFPEVPPVLRRYCQQITCGWGTWTTEECANPWTPPEPE